MKCLAEHWVKLHTFLAYPWNAKCAEAWFIQWQRDIPDIDCGCMAHWRDLVAANPPSFDTREAFFAWGWRMHNLINKRLQKPQITLEEARTLYNG